MKPTIVLIPGHSRTSPGAVDTDGVSEFSRFADLCHWYFSGRFFREVGGVEIFRVERPGFGQGRDSALSRLAAEVNARKPHLWVELHFDIAASPARDAEGKVTGYQLDELRRGSRGLYWPASATGRRVAEVAGRAWADHLGTRPIAPEKRRDLYLLAHTKAPGALVECYFGSNEDDTSAFCSKGRAAMMAMVDHLVILANDLADDGRLELDPSRATGDDGRVLDTGRREVA